MGTTSSNIFSSNYSSQLDDINNKADSIPNYNIWTRLAKAGIKGYASYLSTKSQKRQMEFDVTTANYQASTARMNADFAMAQAKLNAQSATEEMYNVYRMGEHQAMLQGVADAQVIHSQQAQTAHSGVRMNQGSKAEIDTSNRMAEEINRKALQESIIHNAGQAKIQATNYEIQGIMEQANYMAQAYIFEGDARASQIMADTISPLGSAFSTFVSSLVGSYGGNIAGGDSGFGGKNGNFFGSNWKSNDGSLFGDIQGMFGGAGK